MRLALRSGLLAIACISVHVPAFAQEADPSGVRLLDNVITRSMLEEACELLELDPEQRDIARALHSEYYKRVIDLGQKAGEAMENAGWSERKQLSRKMDQRMWAGESLRLSEDPALAADLERLRDLAHSTKLARSRYLIQCDALTSAFESQLAMTLELDDALIHDLNAFIRRAVFLPQATGGEKYVRLEIDLLKVLEGTLQPGGILSGLCGDDAFHERLVQAADRYQAALDQLLQLVQAEERDVSERPSVLFLEASLDDTAYRKFIENGAARAHRLWLVQNSFISEVSSIARESAQPETADDWHGLIHWLIYVPFQHDYSPEALHGWIDKELGLTDAQRAEVAAIFTSLEDQRKLLRPLIFASAIAVVIDGEAREGSHPATHKLNLDLARHQVEYFRAGARAFSRILSLLDPMQRIEMSARMYGSGVYQYRAPPFGPYIGGHPLEEIGALEEIEAIVSLAAFDLPNPNKKEKSR